jgi:hypothetical protein
MRQMSMRHSSLLRPSTVVSTQSLGNTSRLLKVVRKLMAMPGNKIFWSINLEKFGGFRLFPSRARIGDWRNVMQHQPRNAALSPDARSAIQPDRLFFPITVVGHRGYDRSSKTSVEPSVIILESFPSSYSHSYTGARSAEICLPALSWFPEQRATRVTLASPRIHRLTVLACTILGSALNMSSRSPAMQTRSHSAAGLNSRNHCSR